MTRSHPHQLEPADVFASARRFHRPWPPGIRIPFTGVTSGRSCRIFPTPWSVNRWVEVAASKLPASARRIPVDGPLRPVLEAALASDRAPVRILFAQVINAWFERNPDGVTFALRVVFQGQPVAKASLDGFLAIHPKPSFAPDLGLAITEQGLHISLMTIRDARGSEQFRTGKRPTYYTIPMEEVLDPGFPPKLWGMLMDGVRPRTITLDTSHIINLSDRVRQAIARLNRWMRRRCTGGAVAYRKTSSVGEESRATRDSCKAFGLATGWQLRRLMTEPHLECLHCGAWTPLKADPTTGAPLGSLVRCTLCSRTLSTGQLLADRARTRGVHGWLEDISGPRVVVASPVLPQEAKHDAASASAANKGHKAITRGASAKECVPVRSPHKAEVPSTRPIGAQSVTRTAAKSGRPSHDHCAPRSGKLALDAVTQTTASLGSSSQEDSAPLTGHLSSIPVTHTTRGLVRRLSRRDLTDLRSASYRSSLIQTQHVAFVDSLNEGLSFTNL